MASINQLNIICWLTGAENKVRRRATGEEKGKGAIAGKNVLTFIFKFMPKWHYNVPTPWTLSKQTQVSWKALPTWKLPARNETGQKKVIEQCVLHKFAANMTSEAAGSSY